MIFIHGWNKPFLENNIFFYYIQSNEIQENIDEIYCIFYIFTSENIKNYIFTPLEFTYNFFGLPLTFQLTYCSALQNFKRLLLSYLWMKTSTVGMHFLS